MSTRDFFYPIDHFGDFPSIFKVCFLELWAQKSPLQSHLHTSNLPAASYLYSEGLSQGGLFIISFTAWFIEQFIAKNMAKIVKAVDSIFVFMEAKHRDIQESLCQNVNIFI